MRVYIANCSSGPYIANTRIPEVTGVISQEIEAGSQVMYASYDLTGPQVDAIIYQLRKYGMCDVDEVSQKQAQVVPLLFSRDRPISLKAIHDCIARNRGILFKKGDETRKIAAIAADNTAVKALQQEPDLRSNLHMMEMSVSEDTPGTLARDGDPINNGHRIEHGPNDPGYQPVSRKRGRGKRAA